jgi:adenylate cyclase 9
MAAAFWDLKFQNPALEEEFRRYMFSYERQLFRYGLGYSFCATIAWMIFFVVEMNDPDTTPENTKIGMKIFVAAAAATCVITLTAFLLTLWSGYKDIWKYVTLCYAVLLCVAFVVVTWLFNQYLVQFTCQAQSSWPFQLLVVLYCFCPVYVPLLLAISFIWVALWAVVLRTTNPMTDWAESDASLFAGTSVVLTLFLLAVLVHLRHQNERNQRSIFWRTGQSLLAKHGLQIDKKLKQQVILSVVPRMVASDLLDISDYPHRSNSLTTFRPLTMSRMDNVSILFADIVGFTKMSAKKSAEEVVGLLNDLFGRFDRLAERVGCEKISTLGDCYYCVAGCPEPRLDHANCCVDMGIAMIDVIAEFCADTGEDVNMRVGVHTGTVLCGVIGVKRIKFDVWSSDVTFANKLEAGGSPGCVHASKATVDCLDNRYYLIKPYTSTHVDLKGMTTYLITGSNFPIGQRRRRSWQNQLNLITDHAVSEAKDYQGIMQLGPRPARSRRFSVNWVLAPPGASRLGNPLVSSKSQKETGDVLHQTDMHSMVSMASTTRRRTCIGEMLQSQRRCSSDFQLLMVKQIQSNSHTSDTLDDLPFNRFTLQFKDPQTEQSYRRMLAGCQEDNSQLRSSLSDNNTRDTGVLPGIHWHIHKNLNQMSDPIVNFIAFMGVSIVCFMGLPIATAFVVIFISMLFVESLLLCVSLAAGGVKLFGHWTSKIRKATSSLIFRHGQGIVMVFIPAGLFFSTHSHVSDEEARVRVYKVSMSASVFCVLLCCNFAQLFWFVRGSTAIALIVAIQVYAYGHVPLEPSNNRMNLTKDVEVCNKAGVHIDTVCLLILVVIVCRTYEVAFRLAAKTSLDAASEKRQEAQLHDQAEKLLLNIFPDHVLVQLRETSQVSVNFERVGVIFASIVNFTDFYSEKYEHGRECIRVLNELISDFDELLDRPKYKYIDKIKTVGSTYMAASGLNQELLQSYHQNPNIHLKGLVNFALELHNVVESFNSNIIGFNFVLRVGFNAGPVTAGVVGTTKQLYDIWGDTVNISSRMDSTGVDGKIQMTKYWADALSEHFLFEKRGSVYVKGVGDTETCLVVGRV